MQGGAAQLLLRWSISSALSEAHLIGRPAMPAVHNVEVSWSARHTIRVPQYNTKGCLMSGELVIQCRGAAESQWGHETRGLPAWERRCQKALGVQMFGLRLV